MNDIPKFIHTVNGDHEFVISTNTPACIAEVLYFDTHKEVEVLQLQPPKDWFIKFQNHKYVFAERSKYPVNGKYVVLVIRKFWEMPTEKDVPIVGDIKHGVITKMIDWFCVTQKKATE
ncbi:MAG: hypothetical protein PF448_13045 [Bacteroidales bacterium]|jgi:hypothetical protein|nr:hypothetical protein [Bacteroidales bacterium]